MSVGVTIGEKGVNLENRAGAINESKCKRRSRGDR